MNARSRSSMSSWSFMGRASSVRRLPPAYERRTPRADRTWTRRAWRSGRAKARAGHRVVSTARAVTCWVRRQPMRPDAAASLGRVVAGADSPRRRHRDRRRHDGDGAADASRPAASEPPSGRCRRTGASVATGRAGGTGGCSPGATRATTVAAAAGTALAALGGASPSAGADESDGSAALGVAAARGRSASARGRRHGHRRHGHGAATGPAPAPDLPWRLPVSPRSSISSAPRPASFCCEWRRRPLASVGMSRSV